MKKKLDVLPTDLDEAIFFLNKFYVDSLDEISYMTEDDFMSSAHFGAGMFIRNSWQLWWYEDHKFDSWSKTKPKLNAWFNSLGIYHADDMSSILLVCFYRNIMNRPYNVEEQVDYYKEYWKAEGFEEGIYKNK
jgi:hypothetical protein